jgi:hypothetical protein
MSIKTMIITGCAALLSASAVSVFAQYTNTGNEKPAQGCCMSACARHGSPKDGSGKMRCSLTGRVMDTCCCIEKEGKMHCTLADTDVESCCCAPVTDDTEKTDPADKPGDEAQK